MALYIEVETMSDKIETKLTKSHLEVDATGERHTRSMTPMLRSTIPHVEVDATRDEVDKAVCRSQHNWACQSRLYYVIEVRKCQEARAVWAQG